MMGQLMHDNRIFRAFRSFNGQTHGSVSVETVLIAPLLIWMLVATFVFFDGFRSKTRVQVAATTVLDLLTRETDILQTDDIDALNVLFDVLSETRSATAIRVTSVALVTAQDDPVIDWSYGTRGVAVAEELTELSGVVPPILPGEAVIVLETFGVWAPPFNLLGMERLVNMNTQIAARPRFSPWLHLEGSTPIFATESADTLEEEEEDLGPEPTHVINVNIPFFWLHFHQDWYTRPADIPAHEWNEQPFTVWGDGDPTVHARHGGWLTSGEMRWDGVSIRVDTPDRGETHVVYLEVGEYLLQYNYIRASHIF